MYKHTALQLLNTEICMSPQVQACLHYGKIQIKAEMKKFFPLLICFSSCNTFLVRKSLWWLMDLVDQWVELLWGRDRCGSGWDLQLASSIRPSRAALYWYSYCTSEKSPLSLCFVFCGEYDGYCMSPPSPHFSPLSPLLFMCVCADLHMSLCLAVALLQVKQPSHLFLARSNLFDLSWNFGLKLKVH